MQEQLVKLATQYYVRKPLVFSNGNLTPSMAQNVLMMDVLGDGLLRSSLFWLEILS